MQARGRLVEHVDDAEQVGADLGREAQALQLAGRERRRAAVEREVAEAERAQRRDPRLEVDGDALRPRAASLRRDWACGARRTSPRGPSRRRRRGGRVGLAVLAPPVRRRRDAATPRLQLAARRRREQLGDGVERHLPQRADVDAGEGDRERLRFSRLPSHAGQSAPTMKRDDAPLHQRALRRRVGLQHVPARAGEGAHVARLHPAAQRRARLLRREAGVHRHRRLLFGVEDPVAGLLRQLAPRACRRRGRALTRMSRRFWPCQAGGQAAIARSRIVSESSGTIELLAHFEHAAEAVAVRAGALRRVRREVLGVEHRLARRIAAGARVQQPHQGSTAW